MTDIQALATELKERTKWQQTPEPLEASDYAAMIARAIRHLYVVTGRSTQYDAAQWTFDGGVAVGFEADLPADEMEYI